MRFVAERDGFIDSHYVCAGETFEYDGKTPSWARPLDEPKKPELKLTADAPAAPAKRRVVRRRKPAMKLEAETINQ